MKHQRINCKNKTLSWNVTPVNAIFSVFEHFARECEHRKNMEIVSISFRFRKKTFVLLTLSVCLKIFINSKIKREFN